MTPKLLNVGCGDRFHRDWVNLDLLPTSRHVRRHDIRTGLPFPPAQFDAVYSSHVVEHLTRPDAARLMVECHRVLKPRGIVRVVVPDLEAICSLYLDRLQRSADGEPDAEPDYDWVMLELFDQTVRTRRGGDMLPFAHAAPNEDFVRSRAPDLFHGATQRRARVRGLRPPSPFGRVRGAAARRLVAFVGGRRARDAFDEGGFRASGEVHRWMYDRFSLRRLLEDAGFSEVRTTDAFTSAIPGFARYEFDASGGAIRKPDSLFMEATR